MDKEKFVLVKDSLELLRQIRLGLHNESHHSLALKIDEVIACLEVIEAKGSVDTEIIRRALALLANGIAAVPTIARVIEMIRNS